MNPLKAVLESTEDYFSYANRINPKCESLTPEKLRSFPGCENYSDDEANSIIQSLEMLAVIIFENSEINSICIDNQEVVNSSDNTGTKIISFSSSQTKNLAA